MWLVGEFDLEFGFNLGCGVWSVGWEVNCRSLCDFEEIFEFGFFVFEVGFEFCIGGCWWGVGCVWVWFWLMLG